MKTDESKLEIPKKRHIPREKRQPIIDELRLIQYMIKMEYQKILYLLDNASNQPSKFKTKNWFEVNDDRNGTYDKKT